MAVFKRGERQAERPDWQDGRELNETEYRELLNELGGKPDDNGDWEVIEAWPEGSESAKPPIRVVRWVGAGSPPEAEA